MDSRKQLFKQYARLDKMKEHMLKRLGYTDEDNPYGDKTLARTFVWKQKMERNQEIDKMSEGEIQDKLKEIIGSIEKLKEQRKKKEQEKIKLEEEKNRLSKERQ